MRCNNMNIHPSENTPDVHADSGADNNVPSLNRVVLQGGGRGIDESGNIPVEIADDRKGDDFFHNRPSTQLCPKNPAFISTSTATAR